MIVLGVLVLVPILVGLATAGERVRGSVEMNDGSDQPRIEIVTSADEVGAPNYDSFPDGENEYAFTPLKEVSPGVASRLTRFFAEEFVRLTGKGPEAIEEVIKTTDIRVASVLSESGRTLRLTSRITGATYWFYEWNGSEASARQWIEEMAAPLQADNELDEDAIRRGELDE